MPTIPVTSPLGYVGIFLLLSGLFLVSTGLNIVKIEKITVTPGKKTCALGICSLVLGIVFLLPEIISSFLPTPSPIPVVAMEVSTPRATQIPPSHTPAPLTDTSTLEPLDTKYHIIPLDSIANDDLGAYGEPPTGDVRLGGIPFHVSVSFGTQGDLLRDRPTSAVLWIDPPIPNPDKVFILINSGSTYAHFKNLQLGTIDLRFSDGSLYTTPLIIGQNIREWRFQAPGVVGTTSSPDVQEVFRIRRSGDQFAVLDMLTITVPENQKESNSLSEIRFSDNSLDTVGSFDPGFFVAGVTVK